MAWFDIATTADDRSYPVSTRPTGTNVRLRPSGASRVPLSFFNYLSPLGLAGLFLHRTAFRGAWSVTVAPWYGHRGKRWTVQVPNEAESDSRAEALFQLINTGQWDPELEPPPSPVS